MLKWELLGPTNGNKITINLIIQGAPTHIETVRFFQWLIPATQRILRGTRALVKISKVYHHRSFGLFKHDEFFFTSLNVLPLKFLHTKVD